MKKIITILFILQSSIFNLQLSEAQVIHVPADQPTIQSGIDAANTGDTVLVDIGTWYENINFFGKAITVASKFISEGDTNYINTTIIDGSMPSDPDYGSVVTFLTGEDTTSVLCGFTITGGTGIIDPGSGARIGGGIVCFYASAKIINNKITGNQVSSDTYAWGGGIAVIRDSGTDWAIIENNTISNNQALNQTGGSTSNTATGAGMEIWGNARIRNNIIEDNQAICASGFSGGGGVVMAGINSSLDTLYFEHNNVINNSTTSGNWWCAGGGLDVENAYSVIVGNLFENNTCEGYSAAHGGAIKINQGQTMIDSNFIRYNQISGNDGAYGGGISIWYAPAKIAGNDISHNLATSLDIWGGGVHLYHPGVVKFEDNEVSFNKVFTDNQWGGAGVACIYAEEKSTYKKNYFKENTGPIYITFPNLVNYGSGGGIIFTGAEETEIIVDANVFQADTAKYGGGLSMKQSFNVKVTNNLFTDNHSFYGAGLDIMNFASAGKEILHPQFTNNTFFNNHTEATGFGGAMYLRCEVNLPPVTFNNIFWQNQSDHGNDLWLINNTDTVLVAFSNIDPANIAGNSPYKLVETINEDPGFVEDDTLFHLSVDSPCINFGADSLEFMGTWYFSPSTDFDGEDRPFPSVYCDPIPDIGADEFEFDCVGIEVPIIQNSKLKIQNYPNPTRGISNFRFQISDFGRVTIKIYDVHGQEVAFVLDEKLPAGEHIVRFDASGLPDGIYFVRVQAGVEAVTEKIVVMR